MSAGVSKNPVWNVYSPKTATVQQRSIPTEAKASSIPQNTDVRVSSSASFCSIGGSIWHNHIEILFYRCYKAIPPPRIRPFLPSLGVIGVLDAPLWFFKRDKSGVRLNVYIQDWRTIKGRLARSKSGSIKDALKIAGKSQVHKCILMILSRLHGGVICIILDTFEHYVETCLQRINEKSLK